MAPNRRHAGHWIGGIVGGTLAVSLAAYMSASSQIGTYAGFSSSSGDFATTSVAEGMLGSIVGSMLVGLAIFLGTLIASYVARDARAGLALALISVVVLGIAGTMVARFLGANPAIRAAASADAAASIPIQWGWAFGDVAFPAFIGIGLGWYLNRRARDREERESARPVILTVAERQARDAEMREREQRAREAAKARALGHEPQDAPAPGSSAAAPSDAHAAQEVPPTEPAPPAERRSISCSKCGASNAPIRSECLACGAPLTT